MNVRKRSAWMVGGLLCLIGTSVMAGELNGVLAWGQRLVMGTLVSGTVDEVTATSGQRFNKGDLLLALDGRGFRAVLAQAQAESARAAALLDEARLESERAEELYDRTVLSEHELSKAMIGLREAEAEAGMAQARLTDARLNLERSRLLAPFDGVVLAMHASPGQSVVSQLQVEPLLEIAGDREMLLQGSADLATARALAAASPVIRIDGRDISGESVSVGFEPAGQGQSGPVYPVSIRFTRPQDMELRAGQLAKILW